MKRGLVNSMAVLSTLTCAATILLWIRSYRSPENIGWVRMSWPEQATLRSVSICLTPIDGKFTLDYTRSEERLSNEGLGRLLSMNPTGSRFVWRPISRGPGIVFPSTNWLGFGWMRHDGIYGNDIQYGWQSTMPAWLPAFTFATPPALWWRFRRRLRKRAAAGRCETCGYDLRASPDRCPECGADVTQSAPGA